MSNLPWVKDTPEYRAAYEHGWRYSARPTATLDHGDARGEPQPWYDGYLDRAASRDKWHILNCPNHGTSPGTCEEG